VLVQSDIFCFETRFVLIVSGVISCKQVSVVAELTWQPRGCCGIILLAWLWNAQYW